MKNFFIKTAIPIFLIVFMYSCSELNENAIFLDDSGRHPEKWLEDGHQDAANNNIDECKKCHGSDLKGGTSRISCVSCHSKIVFHPVPWIDHGKEPIDDLERCAICHGSDFRGGISGVSCYECHYGPYGFGHPDGWETDHALDARQGTTACGTMFCHGEDYRGGMVTDVGCYDCHLGGPTGRTHPGSWIDPSEDHRDYVNSNGGNATMCSYVYCHGADLTGGTVPPLGSWPQAPSCYTCHEKEWLIP
jgi:hypothetical protein